jgi:hypothetical protein
MNSIINLRELPGTGWEILSVIPEGGKPISGLVSTGVEMVVQDKTPQEVYDYVGDRFSLVNVPKAWLKQFITKRPVAVRLEELEGYLKGA